MVSFPTLAWSMSALVDTEDCTVGDFLPFACCVHYLQTTQHFIVYFKTQGQGKAYG